MSTGSATGRRGTSTRLHRRLAGLGSAFALTVLLTGNVAAYQLDRDDSSKTALVTPRLQTPSASSRWMALKLATTTGHLILVYG